MASVSRKVFFRGVEGSNKVLTSKTSLIVNRQDFVEHIFMRYQCLMLMLLLAASIAVTQGVIF